MVEPGQQSDQCLCLSANLICEVIPRMWLALKTTWWADGSGAVLFADSLTDHLRNVRMLPT